MGSLWESETFLKYPAKVSFRFLQKGTVGLCRSKGCKVTSCQSWRFEKNILLPGWSRTKRVRPQGLRWEFYRLGGRVFPHPPPWKNTKPVNRFQLLFCLYFIFLQNLHVKFDTIPDILTVFGQNNPRINTHKVSTNFRMGGCHLLLKIDGWISTRPTRSNAGPATALL